MFKVALISNKFPPYPCGVGDYTFNLATALSKKENMAVSIFMPDFQKIPYNASSQSSKKTSSWGLKSIFKMINIIKKENINIIHIQNASTKNIFYYLIPIFIKLFIKSTIIVVTIHEHNAKTILGRVANIISLFFCNYIIVQEKEFINAFKKNFFLQNKEMALMETPSNIPKSLLSQDEAIKLRANYTQKHELIIAYFGFLTEHKGVLKIFEACEPDRDFVILISNFEIFPSEYSEKVREALISKEWVNNSLCTGFIPAEQAADLLSIADICIFPFTDGKKSRNGSFSAARLQGTFCITTHEKKRGYIKVENTYYTSTTDNIDEIKAGIAFYLKGYKGKKIIGNNTTWESLAIKHCKVYEQYE